MAYVYLSNSNEHHCSVFRSENRSLEELNLTSMTTSIHSKLLFMKKLTMFLREIENVEHLKRLQ